MHILVGTEGGQLKSIPYGAGTSTAIARQQSLVPIQPGARSAAEFAAKAANSQVTTYGNLDKAAGITHLASVHMCGRDLVLIARKNGTVDVWDHALTGNPELTPLLVSVAVYEESEMEGKTKDEMEKMKEVVGLEALSDDTFYAVTRTGTLSAFTLSLYVATSEDETDTMDVVSTTRISLGGANLDRVRSCPGHPHLLALGGKDRDLSILDLNLALDKAAPKKGDVRFNGLGVEPTKWNGELNPTFVWFAKNLPNDMLDLAIPIWITDLRFVNAEGSKLATCTMYHEVKFYNTATNRRPLAVVYTGDYPLRSLSTIPSRPTEVLASDAKGAIHHISLTKAVTEFAKIKQTKTNPDNPRNRNWNVRQGKPVVTRQALIGGFAGAQGAVRHVVTDGKMVIGVGLDRFVRFWDLESHQPRVKFFAKQRLEACAVWTAGLVAPDAISGAAAPVGKAVGGGDEDEDEDAVADPYAGMMGDDEVGDEVWDELEALAAKQAQEDVNVDGKEEQEGEETAIKKGKSGKRKASDNDDELANESGNGELLAEGKPSEPSSSGGKKRRKRSKSKSSATSS
ncbi:hypothetical protein BCR44DRAFT_1497841 [Catenaria anguillulae PL171]|uniref:Ribosome biogenesis protein NSA1 n=1 Tax=Catenaria anguillulae PL171 TaxID=765915 RepID=A0A1Y2HV54_9FUNG|nr:hypothetical protein BCR44DRAFT_1497841 [Catenaria anguillulae PL171]